MENRKRKAGILIVALLLLFVGAPNLKEEKILDRKFDLNIEVLGISLDPIYLDRASTWTVVLPPLDEEGRTYSYKIKNSLGEDLAVISEMQQLRKELGFKTKFIPKTNETPYIDLKDIEGRKFLLTTAGVLYLDKDGDLFPAKELPAFSVPYLAGARSLPLRFVLKANTLEISFFDNGDPKFDESSSDVVIEASVLTGAMGKSSTLPVRLVYTETLDNLLAENKL